jgi:hypothetical protein
VTVLEAIDRLNSWVRSDSARGWWSSPRYATYDWKSHVIERAIAAGTARLSAIHLMLNCRACGGEGIFVYDDGEKAPCRKCEKSGHVNLEFLVTEIEGFTWHTPRNRIWKFGPLDEVWASAKISMDWEPNQKGRDLELWQVAECLNVCEEAVARGELCKPGSHSSGGHDEYEVSHGNYKLHVANSTEREVCELCGHRAVPKGDSGGTDGMWHGIVTDHVSWSAWACDRCQACFKQGLIWAPGLQAYIAHGMSGLIFDALKLHPPIEQLAHPEIQAWLRRRGAEGMVKGWLRITYRRLTA